MIDLATEFLKLANSPPKDFRGHVDSDIMSRYAFFGPEFAQLNNIDGHEILSVIVNAAHGVDLDDDSDNNSERVERSRIILYCRINDLGGLRRDLGVRVNDVLYTVREYHEISGYIWRIELEENN